MEIFEQREHKEPKDEIELLHGEWSSSSFWFTSVFAPSALRPCVCIAAVRMYCRWYAASFRNPPDIPQMCPRYLHNIPKISPRSPQNIPKISPNYTEDIPKDIPKIDQRYPQDIHKISPRYTPDIPKIYPRYPKDIPKISPIYPQDTPNIWSGMVSSGLAIIKGFRAIWNTQT